MPRPGSRAPHACMYHASARRHTPRSPAAPAFAPRRVLAAPSPVDPRLSTTPTSAHHRTTPLPLHPHASTMFHVKHSYVWRSQPAPARTLARPERRRPRSAGRSGSKPVSRPPPLATAGAPNASTRCHAPHPGSRPPHTRPAPARALSRAPRPHASRPRVTPHAAPRLSRAARRQPSRAARPTSAHTTPPRGATRLAPAPKRPRSGTLPRTYPHIGAHHVPARISPDLPGLPTALPSSCPPIAPPRPRALPSRPRAATTCFT